MLITVAGPEAVQLVNNRRPRGCLGGVCGARSHPNEWGMLENTQLACSLNANRDAVAAFVSAGLGEHLTGWKRTSPPPPFRVPSFRLVLPS